MNKIEKKIEKLRLSMYKENNKTSTHYFYLILLYLENKY